VSDFDVVVVGGGSAGTAAAHAAAAAGARTALVHDGELGGLCILRGCMPTKALLASAHGAAALSGLQELGLRVEGRVVPDFARIMERKDEQVRRFQRAKVASVESAAYEVLRGRGRFVAGGGLEVDGRPVAAERFVIATGSTPWAPPIPGLADVAHLTSDTLMGLREQPRSLVVLGAGAIGLEFAEFFSKLGTRTLLVNRSPLLSHHCLDTGEELRRALEDEPSLELLVPGRVLQVGRDGGGIRFRLSGPDGEAEHRAEAFLVATGRAPDLAGLGLQHLGLALEGGRLPTDRGLRSPHPRVWVAGDATGSHQVLHLANEEGRVAGHNAALGVNEREMDYRLDMECIFTDPPFAHVGLTPVRAEEQGRAVVWGDARFSETGRAITMGVRHGLWRLLVDPGTREIVGTTILGPRADDLVHLVVLLMHRRARVDEILELPWYHPTLSEVMLNVARAAIARLDGAAPPQQG
jgi:pyruvate/2-oxoglutarate dehydrogenase complex dihydrolipoamide dehydrogenase (E3) component